MDDHKHDDEATEAAVEQVMMRCAEMKLYGVLILSPICPGCGQLHDWRLLASMSGKPGGGLHAEAETRASIIGLLEHELQNLKDNAMTPKFHGATGGGFN